jgi:hypothetical protein
MADSSQFEKAQKLIATIYGAVGELEKLFEGRHFTPDGILVGSLGEVMAEIEYKIKLLPPNTPRHDAIEMDSNRLVQIKTNQGEAAYLHEEPDYFIALKLLSDGKVEEIYNGPGKPAWELALEVQPSRDGYRAIRHTKLKKAMKHISLSEKIQKRTSA